MYTYILHIYELYTYISLLGSSMNTVDGDDFGVETSTNTYDDIDSNSVFFARNHKNFIGRELFKLLYYNKRKKNIKHQTYM